MHINTYKKESLTQNVVDRQIYNCVWYFCTYPYGLSLNGWHSLFCIANNRHVVTITTHAIKHHLLIWMTTARQPTKRRRSCVLPLKCTFISVYWWTRQRIHNTLIVVDRYLRLMGDKTIPDSAEPRLESFYPPFVAGIDLPHQGVVDSYNLYIGILIMARRLLYIETTPGCQEYPTGKRRSDVLKYIRPTKTVHSPARNRKWKIFLRFILHLSMNVWVWVFPWNL